jgi:hydroxypyruvate reductase
MSPKEARSSLCTFFAAAIAAVDPNTLIQRVVQLDRDRLYVRVPGREYAFPLTERVFVLGAGKGAGYFAQGLEAVLGERIVGGAIIVPHGQNVSLQRIPTWYGEHPLPGSVVLLTPNTWRPFYGRKRQ